jgi:origin recognition complex subunit 5
MEKLLEGRDKFVLVLDAVDKLREGGGTLIAALARLGEMVWLNPSGMERMILTS